VYRTSTNQKPEIPLLNQSSCKRVKNKIKTNEKKEKKPRSDENETEEKRTRLRENEKLKPKD